MGDLFGSRIDCIFVQNEYIKYLDQYLVRIDLSHYRAMISACEEKG